MNVIVQLEFKLAYYDSAVQYFNPNTMKTLPNSIFKKILLFRTDHYYWDRFSLGVL